MADLPSERSDPPPILFCDQRFVVLNKPAGLKVHPGPGGGPSVEDCFPALSRRREGPWLAHRLDADTAGCLVIALRRAALHAAQAEFAAGRAEKKYWAVVHGRPATASGSIDIPLAKHTTPSGWRMHPDRTGQPALTVWHQRGHANGLTWLELSPRTGRTHQIRAHCAAIGHPIFGDTIYGPADADAPLHLLARAISLALDPALHAVAPPPPAMHPVLISCGWQPEA
jgi:tRNA pseudouridine32 synthase/23S rRNA pseudouridine746 synthase